MWQALGAPDVLRAAIEEQQTNVYPENTLPLQAFIALQTQWRSGMGGREGLIYGEAYKWMDEHGIRKQKKRQDLMWAVQVMEFEALRVWAEARKQAS